MDLRDYTIRSPHPEDIGRCFEIESAAYDGDEAATREKIEKRIRTYPDGFMVIETKGGIVGFINAGATDHVAMAEERFKELVGHHPDGRHIVIMSVVVHPDFHGCGISSILMHNFILRMRRLNKAAIHLMCKDPLIALYEKFGFRYVRRSESAHGGMSWHEMVLSLSVQAGSKQESEPEERLHQ